MSECIHAGPWRIVKREDGDTIIRAVVCLLCGVDVFNKGWHREQVARHMSVLKENRVPYRKPCLRCGSRDRPCDCVVAEDVRAAMAARGRRDVVGIREGDADREPGG